jgi:L-iditol 2-dehydrogenase
MSRMSVAFLNGPKEIVLQKKNIPEPGSGELRIKLHQVGICGSDVHLFLGHRKLQYPVIIGHEGLGFIDKIGDGVTNKKIGSRVVIEPNFPCKKCRFCLAGRGNICINKGVLGINKAGCFAEYNCIPADFAWTIPDEISNEAAVTIEPMAVAYHALFASGARPGDAIAIIGLGAIGLLLTHLALRLGYSVLVTEINPDKLKIATDMGAIAVEVPGNLEQQPKILADRWLQQEVCAVFECAGSDFTASLTTAAAPRGSEIVLVGLSEKKATFQPLKMAREGITILPSIIYDHPFDFKRIIQLMRSKIIEPQFGKGSAGQRKKDCNDNVKRISNNKTWKPTLANFQHQIAPCPLFRY